MQIKGSYLVVGVMSGTSLDGLDLALCRFRRYGLKWRYKILKSCTLPYDLHWKQLLAGAGSLDARSLVMLHSHYGDFIGRSVRQFLGEKGQALLVSSHGHTVFHQPEKGLTFQLGDGASLAAACGITTVTDFRRLDVALEGQGAPLVPVGDELLFGEYPVCLNLGGFANVSYREGNRRIAFDICPLNTILNHLAGKKGYAFDPGGRFGRKGMVNEELVRQLNELDYYSRRAPKSLGREWLEKCFLPLVEDSASLRWEDLLRSMYEHIACQIAATLKQHGQKKVLVTGGGALNDFLMELLRRQGFKLYIPEEQLVHFKEAVVFAFLGLLRHLGETNCLSSVTGARQDSCTGMVCAQIRNG